MPASPAEPEMGKEKPSRGAEFTLPPGVNLDGKNEGDDLEAVVVLKLKQGGKACITKVNGLPLPGYDDDKEPAADGGFLGAVEKGAIN